MLKAHKDPVVDQYTDRSGAMLVKIASRMADRGLAAMALDTLFKMDRPLRKQASFPVIPSGMFSSAAFTLRHSEKKSRRNWPRTSTADMRCANPCTGCPAKSRSCRDSTRRRPRRPWSCSPYVRLPPLKNCFRPGRIFPVNMKTWLRQTVLLLRRTL